MILINRSLLEGLPPEIAEEMGSFFDKQDLVQLALVSKSVHALFRNPLQAAKLLHFVKKANFVEAEKIVKTKPLLMFQYISLKNNPHDINQIISPLMLASSLRDIDTLNIFFNEIKNSKYETRFLDQAHQAVPIILEPLFAAYEKLKKDYRDWLIWNIDDQPLKAAWFNLGSIQHKLLPNHILKNFYNSNVTFNSESNGDVIPVTASTENLPMVRGDFCSPVTLQNVHDKSIMAMFHSFDIVIMQAKKDLKFFRDLWNKKNQDFLELLAQLEPSNSKTQKMKY